MEAPIWSCERKSTHIVMCPSRGKGHINPMMILSSKLASMGLSVTLVFPSPDALSLIDRSSIDGLDILLTSLDVDQTPSTTMEMFGVRNGVPNGNQMFNRDRTPEQRAFEHLLAKMVNSSPSPPFCVIVDMLLTWTEEPMARLGLPRLQFYTAAPSYLGLALHAKKLYREGILPIPLEDRELKKQKLDNMEIDGVKFRWNDVPDGLSDSAHTLYGIHMGWIDHMFSSEVILFNSFLEFEPLLFEGLMRNEFLAKSSVLPIGPLFPSEYFEGPEALAAAAKKSAAIKSSEDKCLKWLDDQPPRSVVYISFGSWCLLSAKQCQELASGLEASGQRFLWVLQVGAQAVQTFLPSDFVDRNETRGLIVEGWAPQHLILSHPAIGGFLTHCGWNSTLECVTLAGVPMIGWPFIADQLPNSRYIVDGVRIGTDVESDEDGFVSAAEVERALREIMEGPESDAMRCRASELKKAAARAVEEDGSSTKALNEFVSKLTAKNL